MSIDTRVAARPESDAPDTSDDADPPGRLRPARTLAVPPRYGKLFRNVPVPLVLGFAATMVLLPTLGVTFVVYLVVERIYRAVRPGPTPALAP